MVTFITITSGGTMKALRVFIPILAIILVASLAQAALKNGFSSGFI